MNNGIVLKEIRYSLQEHSILNGVDVVIKEGEFVVVVGPNGSGKSSLLKVINGLIRPQAGQVFVYNHLQTQKPIHRIAQWVRTLTQDVANSTFDELTVLQNMQLALQIKQTGVKLFQKTTQKNIPSYLHDFHPSLTERLHVQAGRLSGGQRQALALAMCLACPSPVLLLDEYTSALDPKASDMLMEQTDTYIRKNRLTTLMVTHHLDHALRYGTRLIAMQHGRIAADLSGTQKSNLTKSDLLAMVYS